MHPFCRANTTPRSRKSGYGLHLGCESAPVESGRESLPYFLVTLEQKWAKTKKTAYDGRALYLDRLGIVELVGRDRLLFMRVENGVTKVSLKKRHFGLKL